MPMHDALPSGGNLSHCGCCNLICIFLLFGRSAGLPCPCSISKKKEQFVFVLFLSKGKPGPAKRNRIRSLVWKRSMVLPVGGERQLAAEVGKQSEDKHSSCRALWVVLFNA